ncbi:MAG: ribosome recycling factor [Fimbriimonadales bacterium]|jgi:ribosome recycling factor|nr:ribosome recycling factor [Fimbriimonadales bacterium]CUU10996.1 ribosome recycling factor [Armatimonadetes bacterium GBS]CUU33794.1 ribosome recycling factor [Armatimonadetes bacterium GXS]CUU35284.1 ribosome recycling factor [Armatimonadetes bacterium DC]
MSRKHEEDPTPKINELFKDAENRMKHAIDHLKQDLAGYRTGRANPAMVERIMVDYHGTPMQLQHIASITVPEPRQLLIQPWDQSAIPAIEKAIQKSDLGVNPVSDGRSLRITLPPLTEERRKELSKQVHKRAEEGRVAIRNIRRDLLEHLRQMQKNKLMSEDDLKRYEQQAEKLTHKYIEEVDRLQQAKDAELMEV